MVSLSTYSWRNIELNLIAEGDRYDGNIFYKLVTPQVKNNNILNSSTQI